MSTDILDRVYAHPERDEAIVAPIKKMWNEWHVGHAEPSHASFEALLLADERLEEMGGVDHTEDIDWMEPDEREEHERDMEAHGFFSGPRVKLKSRELTLEHIVREEGQLIDIQAMAEELRRRLREAGLDAGGEDSGDPASPLG